MFRHIAEALRGTTWRRYGELVPNHAASEAQNCFEKEAGAEAATHLGHLGTQAAVLVVVNGCAAAWAEYEVPQHFDPLVEFLELSELL